MTGGRSPRVFPPILKGFWASHSLERGWKNPHQPPSRDKCRCKFPHQPLSRDKCLCKFPHQPLSRDKCQCKLPHQPPSRDKCQCKNPHQPLSRDKCQCKFPHLPLPDSKRTPASIIRLLLFIKNQLPAPACPSLAQYIMTPPNGLSISSVGYFRFSAGGFVLTDKTTSLSVTGVWCSAFLAVGCFMRSFS